MIDFPIMPEAAEKSSWIFCGTLYFAVLLLYRVPGLSPNVTVQSKFPNRALFLFLVITSIICAFYVGDFSHYQGLVYEYNGQKYFHLEEIYRPLILAIDRNYLVFRLIVWGGGFVALFYSLKLYGLNPYYALYFFFCIYVTTFSYTRAGLAIATYCLGIALLFHCKKHRRFLEIILGIAFIYLSYCFHKSMIVMCVLTPFAFIPIQKNTIIWVIFGVSALSFGFSYLLESAVGFAMESEDLAFSAENYVTNAEVGSVTDGHGMIGVLTIFLTKLMVHLPFWVCVYYLLKNNYVNHMQPNVRALFRIAFCLYIVVIFMLIYFGSAAAVYYRYEGLLYIPITVMICTLRQNKVLDIKKYRIIFWICTVYMIQMFIFRLLFR